MDNRFRPELTVLEFRDTPSGGNPADALLPMPHLNEIDDTGVDVGPLPVQWKMLTGSYTIEGMPYFDVFGPILPDGTSFPSTSLGMFFHPPAPLETVLPFDEPLLPGEGR
ncbi:MAG: hypothetical protein RMJ88_06775 [Thermogemmata sp.]|nr:hypothetical protein [Thermogemmata sp.]